MTHGTKPSEDANARPASSHGSTSSSGSSKHVKCIGRYVMTGALGKGNFARVESAVHTLTRAKVMVVVMVYIANKRILVHFMHVLCISYLEPSLAIQHNCV